MVWPAAPINEGGASASPGLLRSGGAALLAHAVGPRKPRRIPATSRPARRVWRSLARLSRRSREVGARLRATSSPTGQSVPPGAFRGGSESVEARVAAFEKTIAWAKAAGWSDVHAEAYTLISCCGRAALARALRANSPAYAACTHLAFEALSSAAASLREPAPPCYTSLEGRFGLCALDPCWAALLDAGAKVGLQLVTSAIVFGDAGAGALKAEGFHKLVNRDGATEYELQESDVVCFVSHAAADEGMHRSLVQTGGSSYDVPPMATCTLDRIDGPGEWEAHGVRPQRRRFSVTVSYSTERV